MNALFRSPYKPVVEATMYKNRDRCAYTTYYLRKREHFCSVNLFSPKQSVLRAVMHVDRRVRRYFQICSLFNFLLSLLFDHCASDLLFPFRLPVPIPIVTKFVEVNTL